MATYRLSRRISGLAFGLALAFVATAASAAGPNCAALKTAALPSGRITAAAMVSEIPRAEMVPSHGPIHADVDPAQLNLPRLCRVFATLNPVPASKIVIELWLPEKWNGKLLAIGNHGFSGEFEHGDMAMGLHRGYAVVTTDAGHSGDYSAQGGFSVGSAKFATESDAAIDDFAWRAVHEMTIAGKMLVQRAYGVPARRAYFDGCSNGGREAMREAQQFPADYDGILAGAAAMHWSRFMASDLWAYKMGDLGGGLRMTPAKLKLAEAAATAACDAADGLADGLIGDPERCRWHPRSLSCKPGQDTGSCLTQAEVTAVMRMEEPLRDPATGAALYAGFAPGSETLWISALGNMDRPNIITENHYRWIVAKGAAWSPATIDPFAALKADEAPGSFSSRVNSVNPDLSGFRAAGGKLIQFHGWRDEAMTPGNVPHYYMEVVDLQPEADAAQKLAATQRFYRLFMVPGMQHCYGGVGPVNFGGLAHQPAATMDADHDMLEALDRWVEHGVAPRQVIAETYRLPEVRQRKMPLCPYPQIAYYGGGDPDRETSFACRAPAATQTPRGASPDRGTG